MSVELFKVKKRSNKSLGFEFLKLTANPKVLENLKKSWEVIEFEELERVRTLLTINPCNSTMIIVMISDDCFFFYSEN